MLWLQLQLLKWMVLILSSTAAQTLQKLDPIPYFSCLQTFLYLNKKIMAMLTNGKDGKWNISAEKISHIN